ncbi:MAG: hypothetical protein Q4B43_01695 [Bacteroidota bacterium]|nr:hypothetical protein [Bacteroidota bacterium]
MKKVALFLGLLLGLSLQAQDEPKVKKHSFSAELGANVGGNLGITYERRGENIDSEGFFLPDRTQSLIVKLYFMSDSRTFSTTHAIENGKGYGFEYGTKIFFNKTDTKGFYFTSSYTVGSIEYEKNNQYGRYTYFSFFTPDVGYKLVIAKTVSVDLHVGTSWLIEVRGRGIVDNKDFDNWVPRLGLSVGYRF